MKRHIFTLAALLITSTVWAQCNSFFAYSEGDSFQETNYNANGKELDQQTLTVKEIEEQGDATVYRVIAESETRNSEAIEMEFICENGEMRFSSMDLIETMMKEMQSQELEINMEGSMNTFPSSIAVGQTLDPSQFIMTMSGKMEGMSMDIIMTVAMTDRKVEAKESITTPAGTFDAYKISYKMKTTSEVMGMKNTSESSGSDYLAPKFGVVKSERYNAKGKLDGYTQLTKTTL